MIHPKPAPVLVLIGGFLGAGKTSLIVRAAELLTRRGRVAAAVLNDLSAGLVDGEYADSRSIVNREVAGACFCCGFSELLDAAMDLKSLAPEVIFAEPVGSCIDLVSTVIRPLQVYHGEAFRIAPLTVVFDPRLAEEVLSGQADSRVAYLFHNQLAEADIVCAGKFDVSRRPGHLADFQLSARTGEGVEAWLEHVLDWRGEAGLHPLEVDYAEYTAAETGLGWLNLRARVDLPPCVPQSSAVVLGPLLDGIDRALTASGISIAHLKACDRTRSGLLKASICGNREVPGLDGDLLGGVEWQHDLTLNLRALGEPARLEMLVRSELDRVPGKVDIRSARAFRPAPPQPQYRFAGGIQCGPAALDLKGLT